MTPVELQALLFDGIKSRLPENISLVDEISDLLNVSSDSVYRRIRGEKIISLDEVLLMAGKYSISLDSLMATSQKLIPFRYSTLSYEEKDLEDYYNLILNFLKQLKGEENKRIIFCAKDISLFHVYQIPELSAFKNFFYRKTNYGFESLRDVKFSVEVVSDFNLPIHRELLKNYVSLPVTDIVNDNLIDSTLRQILFYHESSYFEERDYVFEIMNRVTDLINHLERQAEIGIQFEFGLDEPDFGEDYQLYSNDIMLTDNTIQIKMNEKLFSFITFNGTNYLYTDHLDFTRESQDYLNNLMKKSTIISSVGEKERKKYFLKLKEKINSTKELIVL